MKFSPSILGGFTPIFGNSHILKLANDWGENSGKKKHHGISQTWETTPPPRKSLSLKQTVSVLVGTPPPPPKKKQKQVFRGPGIQG